MIYVRWQDNFNDNLNEGISPHSFVQERGQTLKGFFYFTQNNQTWVYGSASDNLDFDGLQKWKVEQVSADEFLTAAQTLNPNAYLTENGEPTTPETEQQN